VELSRGVQQRVGGLVEEVAHPGAEVAEQGNGRSEEIQVAGDPQQSLGSLVDVVAANPAEQVVDMLTRVAKHKSIQAQLRILDRGQHHADCIQSTDRVPTYEVAL